MFQQLSVLPPMFVDRRGSHSNTESPKLTIIATIIERKSKLDVIANKNSAIQPQ